MSNENIAHDTWNHSLPKLPKVPPIKLDHIHGVQPFDGVRNPGSRSANAHTVWFPYKTAANNWEPKVAICESAAEAAVALEALISPDTYDLRFQPVTVNFQFDGQNRNYTHDLLITLKNGHRRLVFVRNETSLTKPKTWREIVAINQATPSSVANDMIVVNANDYSRQRRENLFRMHQLLQENDPEADDLVWCAVKNFKTLWQMEDIFPEVELPQRRVFRACYRLIARQKMIANLDNVICETSRLKVAA